MSLKKDTYFPADQLTFCQEPGSPWGGVWPQLWQQLPREGAEQDGEAYLPSQVLILRFFTSLYDCFTSSYFFTSHLNLSLVLLGLEILKSPSFPSSVCQQSYISCPMHYSVHFYWTQTQQMEICNQLVPQGREWEYYFWDWLDLCRLLVQLAPLWDLTEHRACLILNCASHLTLPKVHNS